MLIKLTAERMRMQDKKNMLSIQVRAAALEYGRQNKRVSAGGGIEERKKLFEAEIELLELAIKYATATDALEETGRKENAAQKRKKAKCS